MNVQLGGAGVPVVVQLRYPAEWTIIEPLDGATWAGGSVTVRLARKEFNGSPAWQDVQTETPIDRAHIVQGYFPIWAELTAVGGAANGWVDIQNRGDGR